LRKLKDLDVNMNIVLCIIIDEEEEDDVHLIGVVPTVPDNLSALKSAFIMKSKAHDCCSFTPLT
jgi:hypothetical protein